MLLVVHCNISSKWEDANTNKFSYLRTTVTADGKCINEVKSRIGKAKVVFFFFNDVKKILANKKISLEMRKRILECY